MHCCIVCQSQWEIILSPEHEQLFGKALRTSGAVGVLATIRNLDTRRAVAYNADDQARIHAAVQGLKQGTQWSDGSGHRYLNAQLKALLRQWVSRCSIRLLGGAAGADGIDATAQTSQDVIDALNTTEKESVAADLMAKRGEGSWLEAEWMFRAVVEQREALQSKLEDGELCADIDADGKSQLLRHVQQYVYGGWIKLAQLLYEKGAYGEAGSLFQTALACAEERKSKDATYARHYLSVSSDVAMVLKAQKRYSEAEAALQLVLAGVQAGSAALPQESADDARLRQESDCIAVRGNLASLLFAAVSETPNLDSVSRAAKLDESEVSLPHCVHSCHTLPWPRVRLALRRSGLLPGWRRAKNLRGALAHAYAPRHIGVVAAVVGADAVAAGRAQALHKEALTWREAKLDAAHPDTLETRAALAMVLEQRGNPAAAIPLLRDIVAVHREQSGAAHMDTIGGLNSLASCLAAAQDFAAAAQTYREVLPLIEQLGHVPHACSTRQSLALVLQNLGGGEAYKEAIGLMRQVGRQACLHARLPVRPCRPTPTAVLPPLRGSQLPFCDPNQARTPTHMAFTLRCEGPGVRGACVGPQVVSARAELAQAPGGSGEAPDPDHAQAIQILQKMERAQRLRSQWRVEAEAVFLAIDQNGDGMLSSSELSGYLSDFGLTDESIEQLQVKLMMHFDTDGNDQIDARSSLRCYGVCEPCSNLARSLATSFR
jgi:tetratricopeptide (TPR) repeat protein